MTGPALLPDDRTADLLIAACAQGSAARSAWDRWSSRVGDVRRALGEDADVARPLLPLLYDTSRREGFPVPVDAATLLRSAHLTETLRARAYDEVLRRLTHELSQAQVRHIVVRGGAVGACFYADRALRHAHDIELLVTAPRGSRHVARRAGFRRQRRRVVHDTGLPLRLHRELLGAGIGQWISQDSVGAGLETLTAGESLAVALLTEGRERSASSFQWVADAAAIVASGAVDWRRFAVVVRRSGGVEAATARLGWLVDRLGLAVPGGRAASLALIDDLREARVRPGRFR